MSRRSFEARQFMPVRSCALRWDARYHSTRKKLKGIVAVRDMDGLFCTPQREIVTPDSAMPSKMLTTTAHKVLLRKQGPESLERDHVGIVFGSVAPQY